MKKEIFSGLFFGGAMLLLALAAKYGHERGYIDGDTVLRVVAMNGLMVAYFGNLIPKKVVPSARARQAMRFSGWSLVLSGLIYAGFWAFAPIPLAMTVGTGAVLAGVMLSLGYCVLLCGPARPPA